MIPRGKVKIVQTFIRPSLTVFVCLFVCLFTTIHVRLLPSSRKRSFFKKRLLYKPKKLIKISNIDYDFVAAQDKQIPVIMKEKILSIK